MGASARCRWCATQLGDPRGAAEALWKRIAVAGWTALGLGVDVGGAGLGLVEQVVLLEDVERWDSAAIQLGATRSGDTYRLHGVKRFVLEAASADRLVALEAAKSATYAAAWALQEQEPDAPVAAAMAKAITSDAFAKIAGDGIQIHGGLGFTWEQDLHLYDKRAKGSERLFGDGAWNREIVARARIDGP